MILKMAKTGTVSRLFGLSDEGLRMYERYGVLNPEKDTANGYRSYTVMDMVTLLYSRMYRQCGFTLAETSHFVNEADLPEIEKALEQKAEELEYLLSIQQRRVRMLRENCRLMETAEKNLGMCIQARCPGLYRFEIFKDGQVVDTPQIAKQLPKWVDLAPLTFLSSRYMEGSITFGSPDASVCISGLGVLADDAELLGIQKSDCVCYHPPADCVMSFVRSDSDELKADMDHMLEYLPHHELELAGDVLARAIVSTHHSREFNRYLQLWMPVKKLSKGA